ncbi:magnesium transporter [Planococcus dechangensis]|uniref:Magnesium transporter MgtE n=1 Tax=Planococcus dechangensis TaxID=1176255 RepID=A0ABV9MFS1_9BACL
MTENEITLALIRSLKEGRTNDFQMILDELQPYDIAVQYQRLPEKHRERFLLHLNIRQLTELMQELHRSDQVRLLERMPIDQSTKVLDLMDNDDLVSLLSDLEPNLIEELLSRMNRDESSYIQKTMSYPPETAGRIMNNRYVWIPRYYTIRQAIDKIREFAEIAEYLNYLYIVDEDKQLVGVVSYKDLILGELDDEIEEVMYTRVVKVDALTDQEIAADIIGRYDFITLPVVDTENRLLGIITVDDVIDVVMQEANEDIEKLSASGKAIDFKTPPLIAAYRRLPWLILLLFIGLISGGIISRFEDTLQTVVALAFFMPMIAGMTGNTGTQSLAVVVRGLVAEQPDRKGTIKLIIRELWVGIIIGVTCAILIMLIAYVWQGNIVLGLVVGSSLLLTLIIGTLAGTIIPLILYKLKVDPAVASGPLITTINDILSLLIYFGLASLFISRLM